MLPYKARINPDRSVISGEGILGGQWAHSKKIAPEEECPASRLAEKTQ